MSEATSAKEAFVKIASYKSVNKMQATIKNCEKSYSFIAEDLHELLVELNKFRIISYKVEKLKGNLPLLASPKGQEYYLKLISEYEKLHAQLSNSAKMSLHLLKLHENKHYPKIFQQLCTELGFDD